MSYGLCRSTNGDLAIWRELVDGRYEIEWSESDMPHVLDIEVMSVINDGTKLVGANQTGLIIKATKIKLKSMRNIEIPVDEIDEIEEGGIIDIVEQELPPEKPIEPLNETQFFEKHRDPEEKEVKPLPSEENILLQKILKGIKEEIKR